MNETFDFIARESAAEIASGDVAKARELLGRLRSLKREVQREIEQLTAEIFGN